MLPLGSGRPLAALRAAFPPESPLTALRATSLLHKTGADTKNRFFGPESKTVENFSQVMK